MYPSRGQRRWLLHCLVHSNASTSGKVHLNGFYICRCAKTSTQSLRQWPPPSLCHEQCFLCGRVALQWLLHSLRALQWLLHCPSSQQWLPHNLRAHQCLLRGPWCSATASTHSLCAVMAIILASCSSVALLRRAPMGWQCEQGTKRQMKAGLPEALLQRFR